MAKEKKKRRKLKKSVVVTLWMIGLVFVLAILFLFRDQIKFKKKFVFEEGLSQTVVTIDQKEISLQEMAYYIQVTEKMVQEMALKYNPKNPKQFWNAHFSAAKKSQFTSDFALDQAMQLGIYYYIMDEEAIQKGYDLTNEQREEAKNIAEDYYTHLPIHARDRVGLTLDMLQLVIERQQLVKLYLADLVKEIDEASLRYDGEYYLSEIYPKHEVEVKEELWKKVPMGKITVNFE